jgi:hypothetical protein
MAGQKIKTIDIITWLTSILIGPAVVHYILHHLDMARLICDTPEQCKSRMLLFFISGFLLTWAVYWSIRLTARLVKPPPEKTDSTQSSNADSDRDSLTFE